MYMSVMFVYIFILRLLTVERICDATVRNNTRQDGGQEDDSQHSRDSGGQENDGTVEGGCGEDPPREENNRREDVGHGDDSQDEDDSSDDSNSERHQEELTVENADQHVLQKLLDVECNYVLSNDVLLSIFVSSRLLEHTMQKKGVVNNMQERYNCVHINVGHST